MPKRTITIGGEERELRFTLRSLRVIEEESNHSITDNDFLTWARSTAGLGLLLYAGLLHEGREASIEELEAKIDLNDIGGIVQDVIRAFSDQLPDPNAETVIQKSAPKTHRSTGNSSGPQEDTTSDSENENSGD